MRAGIPVSPLEEPTEARGEEEDMSERKAERGVETEGDEAHEVRAKAAPRGPSRSEREMHEASHMPYRSWCPHCVRGRGVASPHIAKKADGEVADMRRPVVSMDTSS